MHLAYGEEAAEDRPCIRLRGMRFHILDGVHTPYMPPRGRYLVQCMYYLTYLPTPINVGGWGRYSRVDTGGRSAADL